MVENKDFVWLLRDFFDFLNLEWSELNLESDSKIGLVSPNKIFGQLGLI